jgi:hypothetical protein
MTVKEKAEELIEKCDGYACYAEVAVDEILSVLRLDDKCSSNKALVYWWLLVKEEI